MMKHSKKLFEVALRLAAISKAHAQETFIRYGHPRTLFGSDA